MHKEFLEIVGSGKPTGNVVKGDNCSFRHDINKRGKSLHHQIRLRILSCSSVSENHRGPEVPEEKVPVVERRDGLARITSKELAITHPAKDGILLNVCSTRAKIGCRFGEKCSFAHRPGLTPSRRNGPNRIMTKATWLY